MRKLCIFLAALMLVSTVALAADTSIDIKYADAANDKIKIYGSVKSYDSPVTIIMLNDGYDYSKWSGSSDLDRKNALFYAGTCTSGNDGSYESEIIKMVGGGSFTILVNGTETKINYYDKAAKISNLQKFKDGDASISAGKFIDTFSMTNNSLYTVNSDAAEARVEGIDFRASLSYGDLDGTPALLTQAFTLALFDAKRSDLIYSSDNSINYASELGILSDAEYEDYKNSLNDTGIKNVKEGLISSAKSFKSYADAKAKFKELLYFNLIVNNKAQGYGYVHEAFTKYSEYKSTYGINHPANEDKERYISLLDNKATLYSLSDIAKFINEYKAPGTPATPPTNDNKFEASTGFGGSGGGGGGGAVITPPATDDEIIPPVQLPDEDNKGDANIGSDFSDIDDTHWAYESVQALFKMGVINGYSDSSYKPEQTVTRAEFAKMIVSVMGLDISSKLTDFIDITSNEWYTPYIVAAAKAGYISGYDGMFRPNDIISRQDAAIIMARAAGITSNGTSNFLDSVDIADYAKSAAAAVEEHGLMKGVGGGRFEPLGSLTRAQAATVLYRLAERGEQ